MLLLCLAIILILGILLYEYVPSSKIIPEQVSYTTPEDVKEELSKTENTQIAILTTSLAILEVLKSKNINAEIATGLSLGEYGALIYSGIISFCHMFLRR